ncbi:heat-inducible transcription repressor HrcA [Lysinibacillus alkalisoli]|uniref:Heat-inducible transcription repressor HrcA n=1 Tax=Lysinibacillus alkalisoli TaxID=1911548 RepID=A0A917G7C0_9BACI|nr:heat-inducible transcriptional repressor HrcA [Lysinibacillus alkalisoli]GGG26780.1 heat-inducible transcription repressor HrcA [Lysinibacillus alkalisoli]
MLTNRQLEILQVIVDDFITSAQPVGSRQISKKEHIMYSPATIRNEMADLEEMGLLEKTHTSSGRVPSDKGYRFYVDHLLQPKKLKRDELQQIKSVFTSQQLETEQVIRKSAAILSQLTSYTSIMLGPDVQSHRIKKFSIVSLNDDTAVAIIVTDRGHVENRIFTIPEDFTASDVEKAVNILNERLYNVPLDQFAILLEVEVQRLLQQHIHSAHQFITALTQTAPSENKLFYGGKTNMLRQPEFHDVDKLRLLMDMIETRQDVFNLFIPNASGIQIRIGSENEQLAMENCSVITASYQAGESQGAIAIIGPTRMDYERVITLVELVRSDLTRAFSKG